MRELAGRGLDLSPVHEVLLEESVIGWKEFELEVMRDCADNFVVICSIENVDPMGVHTGDSITVAPALTLTDREYQRMRDAARRIISRVGVETGGSNIQFAINPADGQMVAIEMNPRVSRSSALASKATGFPIAKIAARLALGYHLDEIKNDITRLTPASFEPTIDYVVVKVPRWAFEKFPQADRTLTTQMKSVGEAMAMGRTFKEAFLKAFRSLELGRSGRLFGQTLSGGAFADEDDAALQRALGIPTDRRMWAVFRALERGWALDEIQRLTRMDPWFLTQFQQLMELARSVRAVGARDLSAELLREVKRAGFSDNELAMLLGVDEDSVRARRHEAGLVAAYKRIDTCAAEFESFTPYMYGSYERECESNPGAGRKVVIQPAYQLLVGGGVGTGTLVDFRVVGTPTATAGKFLIVWEDSTQGGDYDSDVSGILRYQVIGSKLYVYTQVFNAASVNPQGFGYTISGTTRDGAHFHSGIYNYTRSDPGMIVTKSDGTAHPNIVNGGCNNCNSGQAESRAEFDYSTTSAGQLEDPLWYAAKWGGFSKMENVTDPVSVPKVYFEKPTTDKANWDIKKLDGTAGADGYPDNYFLAIRPSELEKALRAAFSAIVSASNTAPAVASAQIQAGSLKYLASFDGDDGHGELLTFIVKTDGTFDMRLKTDGTLDRSYYYWAAHTKLTATAAASRQIITNSGNSTGYAFNWTDLPNAIKTTALGGTDAIAQARLDWLRGSRVDEAPSGYRFRKRNTNSIMGPVVSSNPTVTSPPNADFFGSAFPGYGAFVTANKTRKSIVWVGAGDGMLHGFNAAANASQGGTPIVSYVSQLLHSRLQDWVNAGTAKVQSFVDGTPYSADVLLGSTITDAANPAYDANAPATAWKTYLFASLGRGGKGMFALDITNPDNLTEANAASVFKWQFSEADDASGDLGYNLSQIGAPSRVSEQAAPVAKMNNGKFAVLVPNGVNSTNGSAVLYIMFVNGPYSGTWQSPANYIKLVADVGPNNGLAQPTWIDVNNDGVADYIYAGDLKGNLWKFDVSSSNHANWKVAYANTDGTNKRPLYSAKSTDGTTALPITTAPEYRFHPLGGVVISFATGKAIIESDFPDTTGRTHTIFGIWDNPLYSSAAYVADPTKLDDATTGLPRLRTKLTARTFNRITLDDSDPTNGVVGDGYVTGSAIDWSNSKGWYITLPATSEMVVSNPVITQGLLATVSIVPSAASADACFKGPAAYVTFVDPITGLLPKQVLGTITINGVKYSVASTLITDQRVTFARDATKTSCATGELNCTRIIGETTDKTAQSSNTTARIYWREIPSFKTR